VASEPNVTLYHWDLPAALDDRGGWLNPDSAPAGSRLRRLMFRRLGDRVDMWATLNEPWVVVDAGYLHGVHAPGHRSARGGARRAQPAACARHRGAGVPCCERGGRIGIVVNLEPKVPASDSEADLAALRARTRT
jgi:beta-glucosidase